MTDGYVTTALLYIGKEPTADEHEAITSPGPGGRFLRLDAPDNAVSVPADFAGAVYAGTFEWTKDDVVVGFASRMPLEGRDVVLYVRGQGSALPTLRIFQHDTTPVPIHVITDLPE